MPKTKVYLDTSVLSAMEDMRHPERAAMTRMFWERRCDFEFRTSEVTRREINDTPDSARRASMLNLLAALDVFPLTPGIETMALRYVDASFFSIRSLDDALHVGAASLSGSEVLVSWNFRHLVNRERRAAINAFNQANGVPTIDIVSPPEI